SQDYNILSRARAEELRLLVRDASERERTSSFVVEGPHLVERALESAAARVKEIIFTDKGREEHETIAKNAERKNIQCSHISQKLSEKISDTKTPQGIFAIVEMADDDMKFPSTGILLALDDVQDPGNLGTIIRTASW